jgi:hypothetical protein
MGPVNTTVWTSTVTSVMRARRCRHRLGRRRRGPRLGGSPTGRAGRSGPKTARRELVAEVREVNARLAKLAAQLSQAVAEHRSRLPEVDGIRPAGHDPKGSSVGARAVGHRE